MHNTVIVGEAVAGESAKLKQKLESLILTANRSNFDIAETLYAIKKKGFYAPFTTFREYCASLAIKPRKSQYLTRMVEIMEIVGISREKYEPLGMSRLREITSLNPVEIWQNPVSLEKTPMKEFIKGFVEYRTETGDFIDPKDLARNVRTLKGFVGENDFVVFPMSFQRSTLDNVVLPALELAKAHIGSVSKDDEGISQDASNSTAAARIFADYLSDPTNDFANLTYDPNVVEVDELLALQAKAEKDDNEDIPEVTV